MWIWDVVFQCAPQTLIRLKIAEQAKESNVSGLCTESNHDYGDMNKKQGHRHNQSIQFIEVAIDRKFLEYRPRIGMPRTSTNRQTDEVFNAPGFRHIA